MTDDVAAVVAANEAFYAAVEKGDLDRLRSLWCDDPSVVCIHPGAAPIHGAAGVMRSWALIIANTDYIQFFLTDVEVGLAGDLAAVTCSENILTAGDDHPGAFAGGRAQALNVFRRTPDGWRLWLHQAAPVGSETI